MTGPAGRTVGERLGLAPGEDLLPVGLRVVPALSGTGLFREVNSDIYHAAPYWVCAVGRALHWLPVSPHGYAVALRYLQGEGWDLRDAVEAAWVLASSDVSPVLGVRALLEAGLPPEVWQGHRSMGRRAVVRRARRRLRV